MYCILTSIAIQFIWIQHMSASSVGIWEWSRSSCLSLGFTQSWLELCLFRQVWPIWNWTLCIRYHSIPESFSKWEGWWHNYAANNVHTTDNPLHINHQKWRGHVAARLPYTPVPTMCVVTVSLGCCITWKESEEMWKLVPSLATELFPTASNVFLKSSRIYESSTMQAGG